VYLTTQFEGDVQCLCQVNVTHGISLSWTHIHIYKENLWGRFCDWITSTENHLHIVWFSVLMISTLLTATFVFPNFSPHPHPHSRNTFFSCISSLSHHGSIKSMQSGYLIMARSYRESTDQGGYYAKNRKIY
jgi:hypothetical protein